MSVVELGALMQCYLKEELRAEGLVQLHTVGNGLS
jgi:hypothetical protein